MRHDDGRTVGERDDTNADIGSLRPIPGIGPTHPAARQTGQQKGQRPCRRGRQKIPPRLRRLPFPLGYLRGRDSRLRLSSVFRVVFLQVRLQ